ncbi:MAG: hypothetical protein RR139_12630 [Lachnospiraceae bacterium]
MYARCQNPAWGGRKMSLQNALDSPYRLRDGVPQGQGHDTSK